jgi:hypothetical protein
MHLKTTSACPICSSKASIDFFEAEKIPAQDGVVWPTKSQALKAPLGSIQLAFCQDCHYIYNRAHDPEKITFIDYDFSLHYSPTYQQFNDELITSLIQEHDLRDKSILSVACGLGHFLVQLCQTGNNRGLGIDPSYQPTNDIQFDPEQITFKADYYSDKYQELQVDFITCRHLLDELEDPIGFLKLFKQNLRATGQTGIYLEVPNSFKTFTDQLIWNLGYAKRTWYTPYSMAQQLEAAGFKVVRVRELLHGDYLGVEAVPAESDRQSPAIPREDPHQIFRDFSKAYHQGRKQWHEKLTDWGQRQYKIALWGAGMRGINFLSAFPLHDTITLVLDINPHRQGKFLPISGFQVQAPEALQHESIDVLIISNATYQNEIMEHAGELGFKGEFAVF